MTVKDKPKELTLCKNCWCETKTIDYKIGKCGKCGQTKYQKKFSNLVKKLLTQQRTELLEEIPDENFCDLDGTYDYDGIAQDVIDLIQK